MAHLLVVAFDDMAKGDEVLTRLRSLQSEGLLDLEDALVVQRDPRGRFHLKQAVGERGDGRLPKSFWERLIAHIFPRDRKQEGPCPPPAEGRGLSQEFVHCIAERLTPGTSALFIVVEPHRLDSLLRAFDREGGRVLETDFPEEIRHEVELALSGMYLPPAAELASLASRAAQRDALRRSGGTDPEAARRRWIEELRAADLTPALVEGIRRAVENAARRGEFRALVYRFPSELLTDRGRAIIQQEPEWPETLVGQPRRVYEWYCRELQRMGYRMEARLLNYRRGLPGDVGLFLRWDMPLGGEGDAARGAQETAG